MSVICHPHPWMSSMDEVSPSTDVIHWWHFHPWRGFLKNLTDDNSIYGWANLIHEWKCHQGMKVSLVDVIHGQRNLIHGWHPWWGWQVTDMEGALVYVEVEEDAIISSNKTKVLCTVNDCNSNYVRVYWLHIGSKMMLKALKYGAKILYFFIHIEE